MCIPPRFCSNLISPFRWYFQNLIENVHLMKMNVETTSTTLPFDVKQRLKKVTSKRVFYRGRIFKYSLRSLLWEGNFFLLSWISSFFFCEWVVDSTSDTMSFNKGFMITFQIPTYSILHLQFFYTKQINRG